MKKAPILLTVAQVVVGAPQQCATIDLIGLQSAATSVTEKDVKLGPAIVMNEEEQFTERIINKKHVHGLPTVTCMLGKSLELTRITVNTEILPTGLVGESMCGRAGESPVLG